MAPTGDKPSIAVLPLQNLSGDPANDYFSDGMSEEINTKLSHIQDLRVGSLARRAESVLLLPGWIRKSSPIELLRPSR
jgi:TolB-like protein